MCAKFDCMIACVHAMVGHDHFDTDECGDASTEIEEPERELITAKWILKLKETHYFKRHFTHFLRNTLVLW